MPDLRKYWADVRAMELSLPEFVWLASIEDLSRGQVGAAIVEVAAAVAAKLLHARTHRVATDVEVAAYRGREDRLKRSAVEEGLRKKGVAVVTISKD
jgi:hypothetical protein